MPPDSSPAQEPVVNSFATQNDLDFVMSDEEEQAFVKEQLGLNNATEPAPEQQPEQQPEEPIVEDNKGEETPPEVPATPQEEPKQPTAPDVQVELPTAPQTDDLWIEVDKVSIDDDGKQTVEKVKLVFDPSDPDSFIPDDFAFKNDKQLAQILEAKREMSDLFKERSKEIDEKLSQVKEKETAEQSQAKQLESWDNEIQALINAGVLAEPKVKPEDPKFLEDESVKKVDAVFKYMTEQNAERLANGLAPITSFGTAFTMFSNDTAKKEAEAADKKDNEDAKKKASLVGGSSSSGTGVTVGYKPGSYSSIYDVPIDV